MIRPRICFVEIPKRLANCGSCEGHSLSRLKHLLLRATDNSGSVLSVSLRNVSHCGAAFVGILLQLHGTLQESGGQIRLRNVPDHLRKILQVCGVEWLIGQTGEPTDPQPPQRKNRTGGTDMERRGEMIRTTEEFLNHNLN